MFVLLLAVMSFKEPGRAMLQYQVRCNCVISSVTMVTWAGAWAIAIIGMAGASAIFSVLCKNNTLDIINLLHEYNTIY